jgi:hypothetical protein
LFDAERTKLLPPLSRNFQIIECGENAFAYVSDAPPLPSLSGGFRTYSIANWELRKTPAALP